MKAEILSQVLERYETLRRDRLRGQISEQAANLSMDMLALCNGDPTSLAGQAILLLEMVDEGLHTSRIDAITFIKAVQEACRTRLKEGTW